MIFPSVLFASLLSYARLIFLFGIEDGLCFSSCKIRNVWMTLLSDIKSSHSFKSNKTFTEHAQPSLHTYSPSLFCVPWLALDFSNFAPVFFVMLIYLLEHIQKIKYQGCSGRAVWCYQSRARESDLHDLGDVRWTAESWPSCSTTDWKRKSQGLVSQW